MPPGLPLSAPGTEELRRLVRMEGGRGEVFGNPPCQRMGILVSYRGGALASNRVGSILQRG